MVKVGWSATEQSSGVQNIVFWFQNSAFHTSGVGKWVPALTGKAKAGMIHSVSGWTRGVQVKLWDPLRTRAISERLRGVFTTRRYTNPRLPLPLPLPSVTLVAGTLSCDLFIYQGSRCYSVARYFCCMHYRVSWSVCSGAVIEWEGPASEMQGPSDHTEFLNFKFTLETQRKTVDNTQPELTCGSWHCTWKWKTTVEAVGVSGRCCWRHGHLTWCECYNRSVAESVVTQSVDATAGASDVSSRWPAAAVEVTEDPWYSVCWVPLCQVHISMTFIITITTTIRFIYFRIQDATVQTAIAEHTL